MVMLRMCDRMLGLVSTLVLARLLVPADFGLIAMAMSFIALIELASAFSFEIALIQRADPTRAHFDTAWTLNLLFALFCAGVTAALAPLAATFYAEPRLTLVMAVLALGWAAQGFENIGTVNFRRRMDFRREFAFMFGKRIVGFVVTLVLAFALRSYWALIAGTLATRFTGVLLSYTMEPYRPRPSLAARADLFSFSGWMLVINIIGFGIARLPHFVVGRFDGPTALGHYTISAEFARLPSTELSAPINRAVLPGMARLTGDPPALLRTFGSVMGMSFALTLPASIGLACLAGLLVSALLGAQWADAAPLLAVLAVAGAVEVVTSNNGVAFMVLGQTRTAAGISAIKLAALVVFAALLLPRFGVLGMALAELCAASFGVSISMTLVLRAMKMRKRMLLALMWRPMTASAAMAAALLGLQALGPPPGGSLAAGGLLLALIGTGALTYTAALYGLWWLAGRPDGTESYVLGRARSLLAARLPRFFARR